MKLIGEDCPNAVDIFQENVAELKIFDLVKVLDVSDYTVLSLAEYGVDSTVDGNNIISK